MSIKVTAWVWKHANDRKRHRGTSKLLLLALAEYANDSGICWPSAKRLADDIGESERRARQIIKELSDAGDILVAPGGGRGNTTRYGIAVGLNAKQREKLNDALQNTVSENTVSTNSDTETVKSEDVNSEICGTETVKSGAAAEGTNMASGSAETPQAGGGIHHGSVIEPSNKKTRAVRAPLSGEHHELMAAYQEWLGYPIPNGGKEGAAARKLLKSGYTVAQIEDAYLDMKAQPFYADKHLSLATVHEQIGAIVTQKAQRRRTRDRERAKIGLNGHHAPPPVVAEDLADLSEVVRMFRQGGAL